MSDVKNLNVVITGGSRGIGKGIALAFAKKGANIAFTYSSSSSSASNLEKQLNSFGIKARSYKSDASSYNESIDLVNKISTDFDSIDVLINNAGITKDNLLMRISEDDFDNQRCWT